MSGTITPPLAAFDSTGVPTTIGYQLPEPNRIVGQHYLVLDIEAGDFLPITSAGENASSKLAAGSGSSPRPGSTRPVASVRSRSAALAADAAPDPTNTVVCPVSVVLSDPVDDTSPIVMLNPYTLSDDLAALTWAQVKAVGSAGKQVVIYRSASGQWHYRISLPSPAAMLPAGLMAALGIHPDALPRDADPRPRPLPAPKPRLSSSLTLAITSPDAVNVVHGPADSIGFAVAGSCGGQRITNKVVKVSINEGSTQTLTEANQGLGPDGKWVANFDVNASGGYRIHAVATADAVTDDEVLPAEANVTVTVLLDLPPTGSPPKPAPILTLDPTGQVISPLGELPVTLTGCVDPNGGSAIAKLTVEVPDSGAAAVEPKLNARPGSALLDWEIQTVLGFGRHAVTVTAQNADGQPAAPISGTVEVVQSVPFRRLSRQLVLAETLAVNSYNSGVAAGEVVKVFSLLPGETATFSCSTYTKDEVTAKSAASVLDSSSTEASADFEDTLTDEQSSKNDSAKSLAMGLDVSIGAQFGVGSASVKGSVNDKSNSSRENTSKTVNNALTKHASKAASNRSIAINTENDNTHSDGKTEDSTRTIRNINVGCVLNYVYRRVLSQHLVTLSLIDAVLLDCTVDVLLNDDGTPQTDGGGVVLRRSAQAYALSELADFATANLLPDVSQRFEPNVFRLLSNVADFSGEMQSLVEHFVPTVDGTPQPEGSYIRVRPGLQQSVTTVSGMEVSVPGIVVRTDSIAMPTDALAVDVMLGGGLALDTYSQGLQGVSVAERTVAVARETLAQQIVSAKDEAAAAVWSKVFPVPAQASPSGSGSGDGSPKA